MALKYPVDCVTSADKIEFCYITQEALRLDHNAKGTDFREGKIDEVTWKDYQNEIFQPRHLVIVEGMLLQKEELKKSKKFVVDLGNLEGSLKP